MDEIKTELVILWILTGGAVAIMILRLVLRIYRQKGFELSEYFTIAAIFSVLLRGAVIHVALVWGTNQITNRKTHHFTPGDIYRREVGSKLTIVNRAFYTIYTWLQKCVVMCMLERLLQGLKSDRIVKFYWAVLTVAFMISFIVTFTECHPFQLYWQVVPDPGTCSKGNVQLIVFSIFNMATDLMLIALPLPQLIKIKRPLMAKIRLIILFLVGLTIVAVTLTRLLMNEVLFHRSGQSHDVANVEIFFAAFVANTPTIYGLLNFERRQLSNGQSYAPDSSWRGPKSANGGGSHGGTSRGIELNRRQHGDLYVPGNNLHGNESDEEMMIELWQSSKNLDIHITTKSVGGSSQTLSP